MPQAWKPITKPWTIGDIGAPLLDTIAQGLYSQLEVLREYGQNGIDSYVDFVQLTGKQPQYTVQVVVDAANASLTIYDNGVGMNREDVFNAKSIAVSHKLSRQNEFVGFRGIGIWAGLSACDRLELVTTKVDTPHEYRLVIHCKDIVEHVHEPISLDVLLKDRFEIFERPADPDDHFTQVKLVNVHKDRYGDLLDQEKVLRYIEQTLPVPVDPTWGYAEQVNTLLADVPWNKTFNITVNGAQAFRRFPAATSLKTPDRVVIKAGKGANEREVGVAWVCETARDNPGRKAIHADDTKGEVVGFAVRVKNFVLGRRDLYDDGVEDRENLDWAVGEIYITDPDVRPDAKRSLFQPTHSSAEAIDALQLFYGRTAARARGWSTECQVYKLVTEIDEAATALRETYGPLLKSKKGDDTKAASKLLAAHKETVRDLVAKGKDVDALRSKGDTGSQSRKRGGAIVDVSLGTKAIYDALRKPAVKAALERATGTVQSVTKELTKLVTAGGLAKLVDDSSTGTGKGRAKSKTSKSRSARASGAATGANGAAVDIDAVKQAFLAVVAGVVGLNSEIYRQIETRLEEELRRRFLVGRAA